MDIVLKKIKDSPYKLVMHEKKVIGLFDHGRYVDKKSFEEKHKEVEKLHVSSRG